MFCADTVLYIAGFISGVVTLLLCDRKVSKGSYILYAVIPVVCGVINPLFSHNGKTVLFFLNDNPMTLEAILYGASAGLMISAALMWFRSFSAVMDSDKLMYATGALSPKLALIVSMAMRYIPLLRRQTEKTKQAHKAMGMATEDSIPDRLKGGMKVFSGLTTWALENGVITADSMEARGYGTGRRTRYTLFSWSVKDVLFLLLTFVCVAAVAVAAGMDVIGFDWFPSVTVPNMNVFSLSAYALFACLCLLPIINEGKEWLKWKYLQSKI